MNVVGCTLLNARTGATVAQSIELALTRRTRRQGLLGRAALAPLAALVLAPCAAVHTMFMRFAIDLIFVDGDGRALRTVEALAPWRAAAAPRAHAVIELPAGTLAQSSVAVGDRLYLRRTDGERVPLLASAMKRAL